MSVGPTQGQDHSHPYWDIISHSVSLSPDITRAEIFFPWDVCELHVVLDHDFGPQPSVGPSLRPSTSRCSVRQPCPSGPQPQHHHAYILSQGHCQSVMCPSKHAALGQITPVTHVAVLSTVSQNSARSCVAPRLRGPRKPGHRDRQRQRTTPPDPPTGYRAKLPGPSPTLPCSAPLLATSFLGHRAPTLSLAGPNPGPAHPHCPQRTSCAWVLFILPSGDTQQLAEGKMWP